MPDYGLGRIPSPPDQRDTIYPMASFLAAEPVRRTFRYWTAGVVLDQGQTPHCVGFSWAQWLQTSPVRPNLRGWDGNRSGHAIYASCKARDGYNGDGSWVRVGADVMRAEGRLSTYLWAWDADTIRR